MQPTDFLKKHEICPKMYGINMELFTQSAESLKISKLKSN